MLKYSLPDLADPETRRTYHAQLIEKANPIMLANLGTLCQLLGRLAADAGVSLIYAAAKQIRADISSAGKTGRK